MVHSLPAANAIWFILQVFIVLIAFNFIGHALQHEVGQMLHHDPEKDSPRKDKSARRKKNAHAEEEAHHETSSHSAQHALHEQHTHPLQHEHHQIRVAHGQQGHFEHHPQHETQAHHVTHAHATANAHHRKVMDHEVVSSQTEGAWAKVSATDGVIGGLLGLVRGVVLGCVFIMATAAFFPGADTLPDALLPRYLTGTTAVLANLTSRSVHKKIIAGLDAAEPTTTEQEAQPEPNAPANPDAMPTQGNPPNQ